jgi:hypothetical protein
MDVAGIAAESTARSQAQIAQAVQISVLKQVLDLQGQTALALVQSVSEVMTYNNPPNLGNSIDTFA